MNFFFLQLDSIFRFIFQSFDSIKFLILKELNLIEKETMEDNNITKPILFE